MSRPPKISMSNPSCPYGKLFVSMIYRHMLHIKTIFVVKIEIFEKNEFSVHVRGGQYPPAAPSFFDFIFGLHSPMDILNAPGIKSCTPNYFTCYGKKSLKNREKMGEKRLIRLCLTSVFGHCN